jgi:hypothetical protein
MSSTAILALWAEKKQQIDSLSGVHPMCGGGASQLLDDEIMVLRVQYQEALAIEECVRALAAFNAVLRADPICRQLESGKRAWGDIMFDEDERNAALNGPSVSLFDKMLAQQPPAPAPAPAQEFRSFPAPSARPPQHQMNRPRPQVQQLNRPRPQVQVQQQKPVPAQQKPVPAQQKPVQQQKRLRNNFAALDEDSE